MSNVFLTYLERRKRAMRIAPFRRPLQNQSFFNDFDVVREPLFRDFHLEHAFKALFVTFLQLLLFRASQAGQPKNQFQGASNCEQLCRLTSLP